MSPETVGLLCRLVLAGVLLVSAVAKLVDRPATAQAAHELGVPSAYVRATSVLLPAVELLTAALLLPRPTSQPASAAAVVLLTCLTTAVAVQLLRGRRVQCRCFGRLSSSDTSWRTVGRNAALAALGCSGLLLPQMSLLDHARVHSASGLVALLVGACSVVVVLLLGEAAAGRGGRADASGGPRGGGPAVVDRLDVRGPAATFTLPAITGAHVALQDLVDDRCPLLLAFLSPGCGPCKRLRPVLARWSEVLEGRLKLAVVATGTCEANRASFGGSGVPVLLDTDGAVAALYGVRHRPSAVLVGPGRMLIGPVAEGEDRVRLHVRSAADGVGSDQAELPPAASLVLSSVPVPRTGTTISAEDQSDLDTRTFVVEDVVTGMNVHVDQVAAVVWQCLDGETRVDEIVRDLAQAFGAAEDVVAVDVLRLVRQFGALGLLAGVAPERETTLPAQRAHDPRPLRVDHPDPALAHP